MHTRMRAPRGQHASHCKLHRQPTPVHTAVAHGPCPDGTWDPPSKLLRHPTSLHTGSHSPTSHPIPLLTKEPAPCLTGHSRVGSGRARARSSSRLPAHRTTPSLFVHPSVTPHVHPGHGVRVCQSYTLCNNLRSRGFRAQLRRKLGSITHHPLRRHPTQAPTPPRNTRTQGLPVPAARQAEGKGG